MDLGIAGRVRLFKSASNFPLFDGSRQTTQKVCFFVLSTALWQKNESRAMMEFHCIAFVDQKEARRIDMNKWVCSAICLPRPHPGSPAPPGGRSCRRWTPKRWGSPGAAVQTTTTQKRLFRVGWYYLKIISGSECPEGFMERLGK